MKIIEIESMVDQQGNLTIPAHLLGDMGLVPGDTVKLAYISNSPDLPCNTYREFILTPNGIAAAMNEAAPEVYELGIPDGLLAEANIPLDSDIEITCSDGAINIKAADLPDIIPGELGQLLAELDISPETVRSVLLKGGVPDEK